MESPTQSAAATFHTQKPATISSVPSTTTKAKASSSGESTLAPLLRHFVGIDLLVETKQGRTLYGQLREADTYMNLVLARKPRNVQQLTTKGDQRGQREININYESGNHHHTGSDGGECEEQFNLVHIRGPSIRYIIFGPDIDITGVIKAGRDRERAASDKYRRGIRKA